jgi:hypothetical protein
MSLWEKHMNRFLKGECNRTWKKGERKERQWDGKGKTNAK